MYNVVYRYVDRQRYRYRSHYVPKRWQVFTSKGVEFLFQGTRKRNCDRKGGVRQYLGDIVVKFLSITLTTFIVFMKITNISIKNDLNAAK